MGSHDNGVLDKLLHAVHQAVAVPAGQHAAALFLGRKLRVGLWDGALVRNGKHAHPPTEDPERIDAVEGLRAAAHLCYCQRPALGRPDGPSRQWDPVNLLLEDTSLGGG